MGSFNYRVLADEIDVTSTIQDRLLSLRITDESGLTSDSLEIKLDDRDYAIEWPRHGAEITVYLSTHLHGFLSMGIYVVDEIEHSGPPQTMTIRAKACDMRASMKAPKTRSWEAVTIASLVQTIAAEHGLTAKVSDGLGSILMPHLDQTNESDLHLLARLAKDHDAIAKPVREYLVFVPKGSATSFTGKEMPVVNILASDIQQHRVSQTERARFGSVTAYWHDVDRANKQPVTIGDNLPSFALRHTYSSQDEAIYAAKAKLSQLGRGTASLSLTLLGNPFVQAEGRLLLKQVRLPVNGKWVVDRVEHQLDSGGFITRCEASIPSN